MRLAAIDAGTNTTRLLVAEQDATGYRDLDRRLIFTRLGQGVGESRKITPAAMKRTLAAIAEFCSVCGEFGVQMISVVGTSAVRDAANGVDLLQAAARLTGGPARAVSGEQEAQLSFWGAVGGLNVERCLICDIGGGSTEFVLGSADSGIECGISLDVGSVRLTERYLVSDPAATEQILLMEGAIDRALDRVDKAMPGCAGAELVGLGGTVTTLAAIHLGLAARDWEASHHCTLPRPALAGIYQDLASYTGDQRSALPAVSSGRADVIVAGTSILSRIMARWSFDRVVVSKRDILDGLILQMLGRTGG
ncbi:MAG: Ppx/GppA phosphatase family protein [Actinomycetota bacterium]